jgi:ERCC4-type nuclease
MIFVDDREPKELRAEIERRAGGAEVQATRLLIADFVLNDWDGCSLGIERKTASDLLSSFRSKRLERQLARLSETYSPVLLIEGVFQMNAAGRILIGRQETSWNHWAIQAYLFALQPTIRVIYTAGHVETADVLRGLNERGKLKCLVTGATRPVRGRKVA